MTRLRVSDDALQVVASRCNSLAGEVNAGEPPASGAPSQPSSAAMAAGHAGVKAAAAAMSMRMQATGTDIALADISFDETEAHAVRTLGAVGEVR